MKLYNLKNKIDHVNFKEATLKGLGENGGLYWPEKLPYFSNVKNLLQEDFLTRSTIIAKELLGEELSEKKISQIIKNAFNFSLPLKRIDESKHVLELFHGPTLAFKDFGARFMAQLILAFNENKPITILSATSGDTGAAVANAFFGLSNINVVILYPYQRISALQEKMFCTLGNNIHTLAVKGNFDDCQQLVKNCFKQRELVEKIGLNSANSINISRLLAQTFYYFEAIANLPQQKNIVISVPCGNFGNLTAGLLAKKMGLPIKSFVIATNANNTVPRYLQTGKWDIRKTISTLSNAMDVSVPNNWSRIEEIFGNNFELLRNKLRYISFSDKETRKAMQELATLNYIADPHTAIAYSGLKKCLRYEEQGIFLSTAHPAKFKSSVDEILEKDILLPTALMDVIKKPILSKIIAADEAALKSILYQLV